MGKRYGVGGGNGISKHKAAVLGECGQGWLSGSVTGEGDRGVVISELDGWNGVIGQKGAKSLQPLHPQNQICAMNWYDEERYVKHLLSEVHWHISTESATSDRIAVTHHN